MAETKSNKKIENLRQKPRVVVFAINVLLAWSLFYYITGLVSPLSTYAGIWFLAAAAYWLFALITAPFFRPPKDSLATAISAILLLAPIDFSKVQHFRTLLESIRFLTMGISLIVGIFALIAIFKRSDESDSILGKVSYRLSEKLGRGEILFTPVVLVSVLGFYQANIEGVLLISGFWVLMIAANPIDLITKIAIYIKDLKQNEIEVTESVGSIMRIDNPNVVRVSLTNRASTWNIREIHMIHLPNDKLAHVLPLFIQVQDEEIIGTGLFSVVKEKPSFKTLSGNVYQYKKEGLASDLIKELSGIDGEMEIVGLTVERSTIGNIKFQAIPAIKLEEGMVVFANIRKKKVYYQILNATTGEESFKENPFGMHVVSAAQLGSYDSKEGFKKFPWLPDMNQPLFLVSKEDVPEQVLEDNEFRIGKVPNTNFGIPVDLDDLIEYHSAVLGITGTGKTELVFDIVRNAIDRDTKVFCVDFTGEYKPRLASYKPNLIGLTVEQVEKLEESLFAVETGEYGAKKEKAALNKFLDDIKPAIKEQIRNFILDEDKKLGIFELTEITNTKATLKTTEMYLSAIMEWARENRKAKQMLIVLEEAHTIIPEVYGSGFDSDTQWVVGRIGQIALQGRKYGVGLLLVSQRTALVSKTILSQCNTYLTHALVDKTSLDYLSGVYSADHVQVIPNLRPREFLAHGKAVKSERPLILRVDFDPKKLEASKALDKKIIKKKKQVAQVQP